MGDVSAVVAFLSDSIGNIAPHGHGEEPGPMPRAEDAVLALTHGMLMGELDGRVQATGDQPRRVSRDTINTPGLRGLKLCAVVSPRLGKSASQEILRPTRSGEDGQEAIFVQTWTEDGTSRAYPLDTAGFSCDNMGNGSSSGGNSEGNERRAERAGRNKGPFIMDDPRSTALDLIRQDKNYLDELWLKYWANGGSVGSAKFDAYLRGLTQPDGFDLQILRWAIDDITGEA